jgi:CheY-like chemotaxis protein
MGIRLNNISFLVVDDNDHMRQVVRAVLLSLGSRAIREARNGSEAVEALDISMPDILITDWAMDGMDGVELTRHIRTSNHSPNIYLPIIMVTGFAERARVYTARDAGVTEFLIKPLSATALFNRVSAIIENPRQFVRVGQFFGPDRRRRKDQWSGEERRGHSSRKPVAPPRQSAMTQSEINKLFNP